MMDDDLPTEYDVIVVGTGLVESVVAAASARVGKKVLHLDKNSYYGHLWATFTLENFQQWYDKPKEKEVNISSEVGSSEHKYTYYETYSEVHSVNNVQWKWYVSDEESETKSEEEKPTDTDAAGDKNLSSWTLNKLKKFSHKFNIDLSPKILFSKGPMVELLIRSGVSRYTEFVSIHNVLLYSNSIIESVPYSKADVFSTRSVSVVDKRILMKLLQEIQNFKPESPESESIKNETFYEFLKKFQIPEYIEKYILYSIARVSMESSCTEGIKAAQMFLNSLGVYGNSPFLWPLYGSSEIVQAFCRLCAVYGGVYCLNRGADKILVDGDNCTGIISGNKKLIAEHVVMSSSQTPEKFLINNTTEIISRGILITDKALYPSGKKGGSLLQFPSDPSTSPVTIVELDGTTLACPSDLYLVHLIKKGSDSNYSEFDKILEELFQLNKSQSTDTDKIDSDIEKNRPNVLFKLYFNVSQRQLKYSNFKPKNFYPCTGPVQFELDFFSALEDAEKIFKQMFPEEEFLPTPEEPSATEDC